MTNDSMDDALDRLVKSRGYISSTLAFKNGFDRNFRGENNPRKHLRVRFDVCGCEYLDDTNSNIKCSCLGSTEEHQDNYFPEHALDIQGAVGHIAYDISPYVRKKLNK